MKTERHPYGEKIAKEIDTFVMEGSKRFERTEDKNEKEPE